MATEPRKAHAPAHGRNDGVGEHLGCPSCRLRFTAAAAAYLAACPECGGPTQSIVGAEAILGFRLFVVQDDLRELPEAVAVALPIPDPDPGRA